MLVMIMILNLACNAFGEAGPEAARWAERRSRLYRATVTTPQPEEPVRARTRSPRGTRARGTRQAQALAAALADLPGFCSA